jgi:hypothetical protein
MIDKSQIKEQVEIIIFEKKNFSFFFLKGSGVDFSIQQMPLGFDTGDKIINEAAKVLRLLYIQDLRILQTKINETIVNVQSLVADPRTDSKLGKIGY